MPPRPRSSTPATCPPTKPYRYTVPRHRRWETSTYRYTIAPPKALGDAQSTKCLRPGLHTTRSFSIAEGRRRSPPTTHKVGPHSKEQGHGAKPRETRRTRTARTVRTRTMRRPGGGGPNGRVDGVSPCPAAALPTLGPWLHGPLGPPVPATTGQTRRGGHRVWGGCLIPHPGTKWGTPPH